MAQHSFDKQFRNIQNKIQDEIEGFVSFEELFDLGFMDRNSEFETIDEFFKFHGFKISSIEDFEAIEEDILDNAISTSTKFNSWKEIYEAAGQEYIFNKLKDAGFNIE